MLKIIVTPEDIANGDRGDAYSCPVVLAIRREFDLIDRWSVGITGSITYMEAWVNPNTRFQIPEEVAEKISHYDETGEMTPFEFEVWYKNDEV